MKEQNQNVNTNLGKMIIQATDTDQLKWKQNKLKMIDIMKKAPISGIYLNEDKKNWKQFYQFYVNFLKSQAGPRGQCAKRIRQQLKIHKQNVDKVLLPYQMNHTVHIRTIYVKFKFFIPCSQYHQYNTLIQGLQKYRQNLSRINQPTHPMYQSIKNGLIKKRGQQYNYLQQIENIKFKYEQNVTNLSIKKQQLYTKLSQMKEYQNFIQMKQVMQKYFDQWVQADSGMGKDSCNRGAQFEDKVLANVLPFIFQRQKENVLSHIKNQQIFIKQNIQQLILQSKSNANKKNKFNKLHIFLNMRWNPRSLGQIDISIVEYIPQKLRYQALILIECKARLFDIRQASYQVFQKYIKQDKKIQLSGKYGPVYLSEKFTSYIVTTLPQNQFLLPIESKLKATLDRKTKDKPIQQIQHEIMNQILFKECIQQFHDKLSPLDWLLQNNSDNIIVLSKYK